MDVQKKRSVLHHSRYWLVGLVACLWIVLRSGMNPKRLTYPCQQAAMPIAANWLLSLAALLAGGVVLRRLMKYSGMTALIAGAVWLMWSFPQPTRSSPEVLDTLPVWEVPNPISTVYLLDSIPPTPGSLAAGDSTVPDACLPDPAMDNLFAELEFRGVYLHKTALHPEGIVGSNDLVAIKANFWGTGRNTTNTDRIKGLIWRILNHPAGFAGEILVFDNTQAYGSGLNEQDNNSADTNQSIVDVVNTFHAKGYPVYCSEFTPFRNVVAAEFSEGDYRDGFPYDSTTKVTYPKFRTPSGRYYVSLRYGIWDSTTATYDRSRLCIISFPVLKSHVWAGATLAIKNWVGVLTTAYEMERYGGLVPQHFNYFFSAHALIARVMAITFPKLSIIDGTWASINGPGNPDQVVYTGKMIASTDPAASSWYAAKYILTQVALNPNEANPDLTGSAYNTTLTNWVNFLRDSAGYACTKDSTRISVYAWMRDPLPIQLGRFTATLLHQQYVRLEWMTITETNNYGFEVQRRSENQTEFTSLEGVFIPGHGTTTIPQYYSYTDSTATTGVWYYRLKQIDLDGRTHYCDPVRIGVLMNAGAQSSLMEFKLEQNYPNPFNPTTSINYQLPTNSHVTLKVFDILGREVAALVDEVQGSGFKSVAFDASNLAPNSSGLASGVYLYRLTVGSFVETKKLVVLR